MKAEEIYFSSESSDDEFLAQYVGHLSVKVIKKSNSLNKFRSEEISTLHERVAELGKQLKTAKEVTKTQLLSRFSTHHKMQNFEKDLAVFRKSDTNEEKNTTTCGIESGCRKWQGNEGSISYAIYTIYQGGVPAGTVIRVRNREYKT